VEAQPKAKKVKTMELRIEIDEDEWAKIKAGVKYEVGLEDEEEVKTHVQANLREWLLDSYDSYEVEEA